MKGVQSIGLFFLFIVCTGTSYAQKNLNVLEFEDELCRYKGYFDQDKYTSKKLYNTFLLCRIDLFFDADDLEMLEQYYQQLRTDLVSLDIVKHKVFSDARDSMLRYIRDSYEIQKVRIDAGSDPKVLFSKFPHDAKVNKYAKALNERGTYLLKVYEDVVKEQMENNAFPEALWSQYKANVQSEDRLDIASDYVMTFGWWNRVNDLIYHYHDDGSLIEQFHSLFERVVTVDCDDI